MERFVRAEEGFPCGFIRLAHGIPSRDAFTNPFNAPDPGGSRRAMLRPRGPRRIRCGCSPTRRVRCWDRCGSKASRTGLRRRRRRWGCRRRRATGGRLTSTWTTPAQDGKRPCRRDVDGGRGRIGTRTVGVAHDIDLLRRRHRRPGPAAVGKVVSTRGTGAGTATGIRHRITGAELSPQRFRHAVCSRRVIGNPLHRVSDVTMNGDRRRNRTGHGPENPAPQHRP